MYFSELHACRAVKVSSQTTAVPEPDPVDILAALELAVELLRWAQSWLGLLDKPFWVVADGASAKAADRLLSLAA